MATRDPIWDVYNELRTARLNVKYYSARLHRLRSWNSWTEFLLAISAPGSAVSAFFLWDTLVGGIIWKILLGISAIIAPTRVIWKLPSKIQYVERTLSGYKVLEYDLRQIVLLISQRRVYDDDLQSKFVNAVQRRGEIIVHEPVERLDRKLRRLCEIEVEMELPVEQFFIP